MKATIVIFEGVDDLDVFGPFEVLVNAARAGADIEVCLLTLRRADEVHTGHGATLRPDGVLDDSVPDLMIIPGGGWNDRAEYGAWAEAHRAELPDAISRYRQAGALVASVCTGAGILAAAGVLDGRRLPTSRLRELALMAGRGTPSRAISARISLVGASWLDGAMRRKRLNDDRDAVSDELP